MPERPVGRQGERAGRPGDVLGVVWTAAQLFGSRVAGQVAGFVALAVAARWLGPEAFGLYSFTLVTAILLSQMTGLGLDLSAVRVSARHWQSRPARARGVLAVTGLAKAGFGLAVAVLGLALAGPLARDVLGRPELALSLCFAAAGATLLTMTEFMLAALQACERFGRMFLVTVSTAALKLGPVVILAAVGALTLPSALVAFLGAAGTGCLLSAIIAWPVFRGEVQWTGGTVREVFDFSRWFVLAALLSTATLNLDVPTLTVLVGPEEAGLYSAGRALAMPVALAAGALGTVLIPKVSRLDGWEAVGPYVWHVGWRVGVAATLAGACLAAAAPLLVPLVYGDRYAGAMTVFQLLVLAHTLDLVGWPAVAALMASDRAAALAKLNLVFLAVTTTGYVLLAPRLGPNGVAWALVVGRASILMLYFLVLWSPRSLALNRGHAART